MSTQTATITDEDRDILRHMLGLDQSKKPYRNRYAATPVNTQLPDMAKRGLVALRQKDESLHWYYVTEAGAAAVGVTPAELARANK